MAEHAHPAGNIIGAQVRRLRSTRRMSQPQLAAQCQRLGWDAGRDIIARIEGGIRMVTDAEVMILARSLKVSIDELFPKTLPLRRRPR
jgi:transcriptional regulator with XRE-family HTH domain